MLIKLLRKWIAKWQADSERMHQHCREVCLQRDAEYAEHLIWKNIVRSE